jgi:hypothetical protein
MVDENGRQTITNDGATVMKVISDYGEGRVPALTSEL